MRLAAKLILLLFALSLSVQNSCPYGQAGKSPLLKRTGCRHCPSAARADHEQGKTPDSGTAKKRSVPGPAFAFVPAPGSPMTQGFCPACSRIADVPAYYPEIFPDLPSKPPEA